MKKLLLTLVLSMGILMAFGTAAFAATETSDLPNFEKETQRQKVELPDEIAAKIEAAKAITEENKGISEALKSYHEDNKNEFMAKAEAFKEKMTEAKAQFQEKTSYYKGLREEYTTKVAGLREALAEARENGDKELVEEIRAEMANLKAEFEEAKAEWDALKTEIDINKEVFNAAREEFKADKEAHQAIKEQIDAIRKNIRSREEARKETREAIKIAIQSQDWDAASALLDKLIQIKQLNNQDLLRILEIVSSNYGDDIAI